MHRARPLVVAANRDEFYARPSCSARWWDGAAADIFGGRDLQALGTWLAVRGDGRLAAVANWPGERPAAKPPASRGELPAAFLRGEHCAADFAAAIDGSRYAGFNLLAFDGRDMLYASNRSGPARILAPGVYGLSNAHLGPALGSAPPDAGEPERANGAHSRTARGAAALAAIAATATAIELIDLLADAPCFVRGARYGTRASTAIICRDDGTLEFVEQLYGPHGRPGTRSAAAIGG